MASNFFTLEFFSDDLMIFKIISDDKKYCKSSTNNKKQVFKSESHSVIIRMSPKLLQIFMFIFVINKSFGLSIQCIFERNSHGDYGCFVGKMWDVNEQKLTYVNGVHSRWMDDTNVKILSFSDQHIKDSRKLKYFPRNIQSFFPNIEKIMIASENDIAEISSDYLKPFTNLSFLFMKRSKIHSLPGDLFTNNKKLEKISFEHNVLLEHVGKDFLANLTKLETVWFQNSGCIDDQAHDLDEMIELKENLLNHCPPAPISSTSTAEPESEENTSTLKRSSFAAITIGLILNFMFLFLSSKF